MPLFLYAERRIHGNTCETERSYFYTENSRIEVHRVYVDVNTIIMAGSLLTAVVVIFSVIFTVYKWYLKQNQQDVEIERVKSEQCLLTYGILACLKGLKEQGCNGPVTEAIDKIEKHINKQAHDQED